MLCDVMPWETMAETDGRKSVFALSTTNLWCQRREVDVDVDERSAVESRVSLMVVRRCHRALCYIMG